MHERTLNKKYKNISKMNHEDKYKNLLERLKASEPKLTNKEQLTRDIISSIHPSVQKGERSTKQPIKPALLFSWTSISWLRHSLTAAAAIFLGIIIVQQMVLSNRMNRLERQLVSSVNNKVNYEAGISIKEKVLIKYFSLQAGEDLKLSHTEGDSITLSRKDLEKFIKEYWEINEMQNDKNIFFNRSPEKESARDNTKQEL